MWRLVLNAAEARLDVLLGDATGMRAAHCEHTPTRATEALAPALRELLRAQGLAIPEVECIACVAGPGSFTGIRLVLGTAVALRRVAGHIRLAGLNFLQAVACMAWRLDNAAPPQVWALTHARRGSVHLQGFAPTTNSPHTLAPLADMALCSLDAATARLRACPSGTLLAGSGLARNPRLAEALPHCRLLDAVAARAPTQPEADDLWTLAAQATYACADISPLYVRPCDAIDNLEQIANRRGLNPQAAQATLAALLQAPVRDTSA